MSFLIRTLAFCRKELSSSARQPLKVLGLVIGPFIILALFATGYDGKTVYNTGLVVPQQEGISTNLADYATFSKQNFNIVQVTTDRAAALGRLDLKELDAVIVVPENALEQIYGGQSAQFPVYYRQVNPITANYIEYSTYVYASEFDKVILRDALTVARPQTTQLKEYTTQMEASSTRLEAAQRANQPLQARLEIERMKALTFLARQGAASLILPGSGQGEGSQERKLVGSSVGNDILRNTANGLTGRLNTIEQSLAALEAGVQRNELNSPQQTQNLNQLRTTNQALGQDTDRIAAIPPAVLVEPVLSKAQNQAATKSSFVNFYSPAVIILLLQHIGVTLASLSIVRDRQLGAVEIFRVAPINPTEILVGKFLSFMILLMIVGGLLMAALSLLLGVPFIGNPLVGVAVLLSSAFASISLGFLIAGLAKTETQAVQWSMLLILASIFFTGFIVPLTQFIEPTRYVSYVLPMTFGASNLQAVMLDNLAPSLFYLLMPVGLGIVYFIVGRFLYKRQFSIS